MTSNSDSKRNSPPGSIFRHASLPQDDYMSDDELAMSEVTLAGDSTPKSGTKRRRISRFYPPMSILSPRIQPSSPTLRRRLRKSVTKPALETLALATRKNSTNKKQPEKAPAQIDPPWEYDVYDAMNGPSTPPADVLGSYCDLQSSTLSARSTGTPSRAGMFSEMTTEACASPSATETSVENFVLTRAEIFSIVRNFERILDQIANVDEIEMAKKDLELLRGCLRN